MAVNDKSQVQAEKNEKELREFGCLANLWRLMVTMPLWYVLMFGMLSRLETPTWLWVCYWVYLPAGILGGILESIFSLLRKR